MTKNDELRIRAVRRTDKNGEEYYLIITSLPVQLDMSKTVLLLFPDKDGGDLVIKKHEKGVGRSGEDYDENDPESASEF